MEVKKKLKIYSNKFGIVLKVVLLFMLVLGLQMISCPTSYATYTDNFSADELAQINDFYGTNMNLTNFNNMYDYFKFCFPGANKRNITFLMVNPLDTSRGNYRIYFLVNNGTFSNSLNYLYIYRQSSSIISLKYLTDNDTISNTAVDFVFAGFKSDGTIVSSGSSGGASLTLTTSSDIVSIPTFTIDGDFITSASLLTTVRTQTVYYNDNNTLRRSYFSTNYIDLDDYIPPEPEEPSGDTSGDNSGDTPVNPSGDSGGGIDYTNQLNNINTSIDNVNTSIMNTNTSVQNVQNQISGDTQKIINTLSGETQKITNTLTESADDLIGNTTITSGDIENALNFEIAQDPYSNFWFTLTNNLKSALLGTKRSIDISFQGRTWTISLDEYMVLPSWLIIILTPFSTAFFTWVLVRQFKLIFDKLASGNVDSLLKENSEERHFKFVLGGE